MKPLPRADGDDPVAIDGNLWNRLCDEIERMDRLSVAAPLELIDGPAGKTLAVRMNSAQEQVLVAVLRADPGGGGGRYSGRILTGNSTGNTSNNFQLDVLAFQTVTDGPQYPSADNALIINLAEPYVTDSHILCAVSGPTPGQKTYAVGRIMGQTSESTPRTIVYIESWPYRPVIVEITGTYTTSYGGVYYGRIVRSMFAGGSGSYAFPLPTIAAGFVGPTDTCWLVNNWEQQYIGATGRTLLPIGTYVPAMTAGFPIGNATSTGNWHLAYTWFAPQAAAMIAIQNRVVAQTAGATYGSNEQAMLNNLNTDVNNLWLELKDLYAKLKAAGYMG